MPVPTPAAGRLSSLRVGRRTILVAEGVAFLLLWELAVDVFQLVSVVFVPAPIRIAGALVELVRSGDLAYHGVYSIQNFATGYLLALAFAVAGGLLLGSSNVLGHLVGPLAWSLYAMPLVAILPMTTIWFGFGAGPAIFIVFASAFLPMLLNTMSGVRTVDPSLVRAARVFGAGQLALWKKIVLPSTVPFVLAGMRLALIAAFVGLFVAEAEGGARGVGSIVATASSRFLVDRAFAAIVVLVLASTSLVRVVGLLERRVSAWRPRG